MFSTSHLSGPRRPLASSYREVNASTAIEGASPHKLVSLLFHAVTGEIAAVNEALVDAPALANEAPEAAGWFFQVALSNPSELEGLMDRAAYDAYVAGLE